MPDKACLHKTLNIYIFVSDDNAPLANYLFSSDILLGINQELVNPN